MTRRISSRTILKRTSPAATSRFEIQAAYHVLPSPRRRRWTPGQSADRYLLQSRYWSSLEPDEQLAEAWLALHGRDGRVLAKDFDDARQRLAERVGRIDGRPMAYPDVGHARDAREEDGPTQVDEAMVDEAWRAAREAMLQEPDPETKKAKTRRLTAKRVARHRARRRDVTLPNRGKSK